MTNTLALVLGGGGSVGIAWEIGVLAGLTDAGVDATEASVIVGSSAGSVAGTQVRQGRSIESLVDEQRTPSTDDRSDPPRPTDLSGLFEIFGMIREAEERTPALFREVGRRAIAADTLPESVWIGRFEHLGDEWPDGDLRVTAVDCATGQRRIWTAADGVPLCAAVASSCAIPGVFPPVSLDGTRFIDGGLWSSSNLDAVLDADVDRAIFIGPLRAGDPAASRALAAEIGLLESEGVQTTSIVPGEAFATEIGAANLMNPTFRARGLALGIDDGTAAARRVQVLLA